MTATQKLRNMISSKGVTYTHIAARTGISIGKLSKSFAGQRKLLADEFVAICTELGVDLKDFCDEVRQN